MVGRLVLVGFVLCACGADEAGRPRGDPPTIEFGRASSIVEETAGPVMVPLTLSNRANEWITVSYSVGGSATAGVDFDAGDGTLMVPPGIVFAELPVSPRADNLVEGDETIELVLDDASFGSVGQGKYTLHLRDMVPHVSFTGPDSQSSEWSAAAEVVLRLDRVASDVITVDYVVGGTATSADHDLVSGTVLFPPGVTARVLPIHVMGDVLDEDDESVIVTLTQATQAAFGPFVQTTHLILDDDPTPSIAFETYSQSITEGAGVTAINVNVVLSAPSGRQVSAGFSASNWAGVVVHTQSPLVFAPGETMKTISLELQGNDVYDGYRYVTFYLANVVNAVGGWPYYHQVSIIDDDCYGQGNFAVCPSTLPTGSVTLPAVIDTDDPACGQPINWAGFGHVSSCFVMASSITVSSTRVHGSRALVLFALDSIVVTSQLDASSQRGGSPGPGAETGWCGQFDGWPGTQAGGAGGSFTTAGGNGGAHVNPTAAGGISQPGYGEPYALRGGCGGQTGFNSASPGGAGGGAVFIIAMNSIVLQPGAIVNASGAGAAAPGPGAGASGGGAGGMIALWAPSITANQSFLVANGGGGAEGGTQNSSGIDGSDPTATTPWIAAPGGRGTSGGDGGNGFAEGSSATNGAIGTNNNGAGGGGGGAGFIRTNQPLTGARVSPAPVIK